MGGVNGGFVFVPMLEALQLIYKHAVSTLMPQTPVQLFEGQSFSESED